MSEGIDIKGRNKAELLAKLYNASRPLGMSSLHFTPEDMAETEAEEWIENAQEAQRGRFTGDRLYFDYLKGRVMKVELSGDTLDPGLYDRDNGEGAAQRAIESR